MISCVWVGWWLRLGLWRLRLDQHQPHFRRRTQNRIDSSVSHWNDNPEPFVWTKPADEILDKVARGQATLDRITKSATHHT